jgi:hypothetical protein
MRLCSHRRIGQDASSWKGGGTVTDSKLPPGQRPIAIFPRFGVPRYANRVPRAVPIELALIRNGQRA